jgi:hypothetical protein
MSAISKPQRYRDVIDTLVEVCKRGQGQIGAERVREGVWNEAATPEFAPEQHRYNLLLSRLSREDRDTLAEMLAAEVVTGVFETLKTLGEFEIVPFSDGYEGEAYHDFVGRLADWEWPENER